MIDSTFAAKCSVPTANRGRAPKSTSFSTSTRARRPDPLPSPKVRTTTGPDGQFHFAMEKSEFDSCAPATPGAFTTT